MKLTEKETIRLNVGGTIFKTYKKTLSAFPGSKLDKLNKQNEDFDSEQNEFYFDRNPLLFAYVLDAFRKGAIHMPKDICGTTFRKELEFWELPLYQVAPCCLEALYRSEDDIETMDCLMKNECVNEDICERKEQPSFRKRLWLFLDDPSSSKSAQVWNTLISLLVVASTFLDALTTVSAFQQSYTEPEIRSLQKIAGLFDNDNATLEFLKTAKPKYFIMFPIIVCHSILTLELIISLLVCENKKAYMICFTRICACIGYAFFWIAISLHFNLEHLNSEIAVATYLILGYLQAIKLARLFYFTKHIPAFAVIGFAIRSSLHECKILAFMLVILSTVFGYFMYAAEYLNNSKLSNVFSAIYWALITVTTVGYGDYTPKSTLGHVIACLCAVTGVMVLALPIGIIASNFYKFYNFHGYSRKHVETLRHCPSLKNEHEN